jgi:nicotinamidase-related amidase
MQKNQSGLLVMDVQNGIVARYAEKPEMMAPFQRAVHTARYAGIPVIFVRIAFRDGCPEVSPRNKSFSPVVGRSDRTIANPATKIRESVAPCPDEAIVTKC